MNEITRIHIAKVAYDIEVPAKKQLQKYISSLETYTQDADVAYDIEIRMTELLAERGVSAGGVIGSDDVTAVQKQLGEPYEFADGEGDIATGAVHVMSRRFYRSTDDAILGGVLSGMAAYFGINPLWTRLAFFILLFVSFGMVTFVYVFFWIFAPAARTATEKLRLAGKDVTVESIRELNALEEPAEANRIAPMLRSIILTGAGIMSLLTAVVSFSVIIWALVSAWSFDGIAGVTQSLFGVGGDTVWLVWVLFWIVIAGMTLFTALAGLLAYAFFSRKATRRIIVSAVVIIALGLVSVVSAVGVTGTQSWRLSTEARQSVRQATTTLPAAFANINSLTFAPNTNEHELDGVAIKYVVDNGPARYELTALPTVKPTITIDGQHATVSVAVAKDWRSTFTQPSLTIYGPALETLALESGRWVSYEGMQQPMLHITSTSNASVQVSGSYKQLEIKGSGVVDMSGSAVERAVVVSDQGLFVTLATVRELTVTQPETCPSSINAETTSVSVRNVTLGEMTYNGKTMPAKTYQTDCASVVVTGQDDQNLSQGI